MKVFCPKCRTAYNIPEDRIGENGLKATCKKCGAEMVVRLESGDDPLMQGPIQSPKEQAQTPETTAESSRGHSTQPEEASFSVGAQSPVYPKHRDAWIILVAAVILILILFVGYFVLRGSAMPYLKIKWNPVASFIQIIKGGEVYEICESFVLKNEPLFQSLGQDLQLSLIRQNVKSVNRRKTGRVLVKIRGTKATGQVYFQLRKDDERWRVVKVDMKIGKGKFQPLYPRGNLGMRGKI